MTAIKFKILPVPDILKNDLECFRLSTYAGLKEIAVRVCPNGFPGIVFQHHNGKSVIKNIVTDVDRNIRVPTLFAHGQVTALSVMHFRAPFTTLQVILKPHALNAIFGIDASKLTNNSLGMEDLGALELNDKLIKTKNNAEKITLLSGFLAAKRALAGSRDTMIEKCLAFIDGHLGAITAECLLGDHQLSERQFQKRFKKTVGITPQLYIRIKRVNKAFRLMDSGKYKRLVDVAYKLNFFDQSHFIRDIKAFSGVAPKSISQKVADFNHDQVGSSYVYR